MIFLDEDSPAPRRKLLIPPSLDSLGVDELAGYIIDLDAEIMRVKAAISAKDAHKSAAAAFFKAPNRTAE